MSKEKVYISAPITGFDLDERKRYFGDIAATLKLHGYEPVNPMKNGVPLDADVKEHLRVDFRNLLDCDYILLCDGWENSRGCQKEASLALWCGIPMLPKKEIGL